MKKYPTRIDLESLTSFLKGELQSLGLRQVTRWNFMLPNHLRVKLTITRETRQACWEMELFGLGKTTKHRQPQTVAFTTPTHELAPSNQMRYWSGLILHNVSIE